MLLNNKYVFTSCRFRKHICLNNPWEIKTKFLNDEILNVIRKEDSKSDIKFILDFEYCLDGNDGIFNFFHFADDCSI